MKLIEVNDLATAHRLAVKHVLECGVVVNTEDNEKTIQSDSICITVKNPINSNMVNPASKLKTMFLDKYADNLIWGTESEFVYDYHTRLYEYNGAVNQIDYMINKLKANPTSRRAIAITWKPELDTEEKDVPCLQLIECDIVRGKLNMTVVFRSNDMLTALGANMYALVRLQEYIAKKVGIPIGSYTHISLIPHIYYVRDASDLPAFCKTLEKKEEYKTRTLVNYKLCAVCKHCFKGH